MHANSLRRLGAALALAAAAGCAPAPVAPPMSAPAPAPLPAAPLAVELEEATVAQLQEGMRAGRWTSRALVEGYLARIEALDRSGPTLRSVIETNPDALAIADSLDAERRAGRVRGPLHGIPILLKDNIDTGDRMQTTAGSLALVGQPAPRDAGLVERLRAAGAVILGKTNLSEWANFRSTGSSSGWSARGGQTRNPYVLDRSPCGSSSGSGVAVAASLAAAAVGTETDGSIVCPAAANGVVGIKPTVGLVSRSGVVPISHTQDTGGPMARTVADATLLLGALAGPDPRDPVTAAARERVAADYTRFVDPNGLRGARIGVVRQRVSGYDRRTDSIYDVAVAALRRAGATVVDSVRIPHLGEYDEAEFTVLLHEFKHDLNAYLAERGSTVSVRTLADVIAFNQANAARAMPYFGQELMLMAQEKGPLTEKAYRDALAKGRLARVGIDSALALHRLDALVAPTGSPSWPIDLVGGDRFLGGSSSPAAVSGYPAITVPAGFVFGLPVGISFIGGAWSEPTLIRLASGFEAATRVRQPPRYLPAVGAPAP